MVKHKSIDVICIMVAAAMVIGTLLFMNGEALGLVNEISTPPYAGRIFDDSVVHTIDIQMEPDDWDDMLENALGEEYSVCSLVIDGEIFENIGIRPKGNNSKNLINRYGSERYSLKIEFDHFSDGLSYYGLDKLSLNSSFQDNAYFKDYMTYDMMRRMGVATPLCSYVWVTVNGEDWGLFVAVEEIEDSFLRRNYGTNHGRLYKPDYKSLEDENNDVALIYTGDDLDDYDNIFREAKARTSKADKQRLIEALRILSTGENLERAVNVDFVLRYFTVQTFVVNLDSYLGPTGHNYFLYEEDGVLSMLPWDYNLAYATYALGMPSPINDSTMFVNYPIDTPYSGEVMLRRPMYHKLMQNDEYFARYHEHYDAFLRDYFESGYFSEKVAETKALIAPYVKRDPTKFCSYEDFLLAVETFEEFCLLRAESVRGQLDGTIPSTIRGQQQDKSAFVDASHIWIPDLGELDDMK